MSEPSGSGPQDVVPPADVRWRRSAKALLLDARDGEDAGPDGTHRLLLLHMRDPGAPAKAPWWELPGGGLEPGEDERTACAREVAEETGWQVDVDDVGPGLWTRRATFVWYGTRRWQAETVHVVRLRPGTPRRELLPTDEEAGALLELRWWTVSELTAAVDRGERTYPGRLLELAPHLLAGESVDEGFEVWD